MTCYKICMILLLLSIAVISNGNQVVFYALSNSRGFRNTTTAAVSCENLPEAFWRKASYIRTVTCVILYSNSDCAGDEVEIEAGVIANLNAYRFDNTAVSLRSCNRNMFKPAVDDRRVKFYNHDNYRDLLLDTEIGSGCTNMPFYHRNMASSVKTDGCVMLYSHPNCNGIFLGLGAGNHPILPDFDEEADSFKPC